MAMSQITGEFVPKVQIEGVQTVVPSKVTDPREICLVKDPVSSDIFRGCLNIVLCYSEAGEEGSGGLVAGWIKESLGRAMQDQPMLSGRLRRVEDGNGELEMVPNDTGVRLVDAKIEMSLQEFLGLEEREKAEAELVFWKDIDEQNPIFSPLLYVQVTDFQCGGYSIGISSSILLADHIIIDNFFSRWSGIQEKLLPNNSNGLGKSMFYLPNLRNTSSSPHNAMSPTPGKRSGQTLIFKIAGDREIEGVKNESWKSAVSHCIQEAEHKLGGEMPTGFSLFVKESPEVIRIQSCKKNELVKSNLNFRCQAITLDDLGVKELAFRHGNKPTHVSCWIGSADDGLVMAIPSSDEKNTSDFNVMVTIPEGN
ncbi:hypothetical protein OIU77_027510 [Salix suchowensis]|uniref:Uncharacterized protein n=1 Tax=Salix suchowensis TaxID=1278906 RepID=A0ABQ9BTS4_9ROSI|nr:transferase family protein [Salix suchowensis]KAJ6389180.1 hypothetical protein OIU77_027510 [Salix suchowensis]